MAFFNTCIDIFAIASGYVGVMAGFRFSRLIEIWLQVVFVCVVSTLCIMYFTCDAVGVNLWIRSIMPIAGAQYWYMTAYFMLAFTMPFLNAGIQSLDKRTSGIVIGTMLAIICGQGLLGIYGGLGVAAGYSYAWLVVLYLVGAYWRLYGERWQFASIIWCCPLIPLAFISGVLPMLIPGEILRKNIWLNYTSPFTVLLAVFIFGLSLSIKVKNLVIVRLIKLIGGCTLGIYLFHQSNFLHQYVILPYIRNIKVEGAFDWLMHVVCTTIVVFVACALIDYLRQVILMKIRLTRSTRLVSV